MAAVRRIILSAMPRGTTRRAFPARFPTGGRNPRQRDRSSYRTNNQTPVNVMTGIARNTVSIPAVRASSRFDHRAVALITGHHKGRTGCSAEPTMHAFAQDLVCLADFWIGQLFSGKWVCIVYLRLDTVMHAARIENSQRIKCRLHTLVQRQHRAGKRLKGGVVCRASTGITDKHSKTTAKARQRMPQIKPSPSPPPVIQTSPPAQSAK